MILIVSFWDFKEAKSGLMDLSLVVASLWFHHCLYPWIREDLFWKRKKWLIVIFMQEQSVNLCFLFACLKWLISEI